MVVGQNPKNLDIEVNVCKRKQLTNTRASGSDDALKLTPPKVMSLEQALEFIDTDELLEVTPEQSAYPQEDPGSSAEKEIRIQQDEEIKL